MKNKNLGKNYLEKNKTSPLLKTPEKDFQVIKEHQSLTYTQVQFFKASGKVSPIRLFLDGFPCICTEKSACN